MVFLKCKKCGKEISASNEEEAKEKLIAHDEEMHTVSFSVQCPPKGM